MSKIECSSMSIAGIESSLEYARQKHTTIVSQLFSAVYEIEQFEVALRNAKRAPGDLRPLESAGDPNCVSHEWHGDPENEQMFCSKCSARFDVLTSEFLKGFPSVEELQNAIEKAAEVLRSEFLAPDEYGDDAQKNSNDTGFPFSFDEPRGEKRVAQGKAEEEHF